MTTSGASVYRKDGSVSQDDRTNLFRYFVPAHSKMEPDQEIQYKSINDADAALLALGLQKTVRDKASIAFAELSPKAAFGLFKNAFGNDNLKSIKFSLGEYVKFSENVLMLNFGMLTPEEAGEIAKIIDKSAFEKIEITCQNIPVDAVHLLLESIGHNAHVKQINIKIPDYNVDTVGALKAYLAARVRPASSEQQDLGTLPEAFSALLISAQNDITEMRQAAGDLYTGALERGRTFVSSVLPTLQSFLADEEPAAVDPNALPQAGRSTLPI
jgi:hypothetical protein